MVQVTGSWKIAVPVAIGALAVGFVAGALLGRGPSVMERTHEKPEETVPTPITPAQASPSPPDIEVNLQPTIKMQHERIVELEEQVRELQRKASGIKTKNEKLAIARKIYETFTKFDKGRAPNPEEIFKAMSRLGELDEDMASFFIDRFREEKAGEDTTEENMALMLAVISGGPDVTALVKEMIQDPNTSAIDRSQLMVILSGENGMFTSNRIPMDSELSQTAILLVHSSVSEDRKGGAGLLGGADTLGSRLALQDLAFNDPDLAVKTAAIRSLGYVGDNTTLQFLEGYQIGATPELTGDPAGDLLVYRHNALDQALKSAIVRIKKKLSQ